jgi:alpha-glucosidase (family GH31 glycosyl hydrolase)
LRSQEQQPAVDSSPTQRAKPRSDFSWNDLKINLKMMLVKGTVSESFYRDLLIPALSGQFDNELLVRWFQSFCLIPFFKITAIKGQFSDSTIESIVDLREHLTPYIQAVVALSRDYKRPILRALDRVEPENSKVRGIEDIYLLGDSLLVAPVTVQGALQRYVYLPEGYWYNFESNSLNDGSQYVAVDAPLQTLPIFVKAGTVLPLRQFESANSPEDAQTLLYRVYPGHLETVLYEDNTTGFDQERTEYRWIYITCSWEEGKLIIKRRIAGQFEPAYAHIRVEVVGLGHEPLAIRIDRRPAPLWYFDQGMLEFTTESFQIIEIVMEEVAAEA